MVVIKQCNCDHAFQDKTYGKKMRVCNTLDKSTRCRCSVCGKEI